MIVLDASLAVKWYADEDDSELAQIWLEQNAANISVPDIFVSEVTGALVRRANMETSLRPDVEASIKRFIALFDIEWLRQTGLNPHQMGQAAQLALDLGRPLKDCIYLALAMELECELMTGDARFAAKAREVWDLVRVLGAS